MGHILRLESNILVSNLRPGAGSSNEGMRQMLPRLGSRRVLKIIYVHVQNPQSPLWRINARHTVRMIRLGEIVICHDRSSWTAPMLRNMSLQSQRRDYRINTLTRLLQEAD